MVSDASNNDAKEMLSSGIKFIAFFQTPFFETSILKAVVYVL